MKIILSGYMGSGKTVVGQALALHFHLPFKDLDEEITKSEGRDISEIFKTSGEIYFRKKESEVLLSLLNQEESFILSLGGGTPCYGQNLEWIKQAPDTRLIYLQTGLQELTRRLFEKRDARPLIQHFEDKALLEDFIRKHLFERTYYYNQSDLTVATDGKSTEEVAAALIEKLT